MKYILSFIALFFLCASSMMWQAIRTDNTLTGEGTDSLRLKVDTTVIATLNDLLQERGNMNVISPAQLTADADDYAPTGWQAASIVRLLSDSGMRAITSMAAYTGASAADKAEKTLINIGSYPFYIPGEHPDGTAANRVAGLGSDFIVYPGKAVKIYYDQTDTRWRITGGDTEYTKPTIYYSWSAGSVTAADYGNIAFAAINSGSIAATSSSTTLPAAATISTLATTTGGGKLLFSKTVNTFSAFASAHLFTEATISIPTLSDGTDTYAAEVQITSDAFPNALESNNTIGVRYSHSINGGDWELFTQDAGGSESVTDLNVAVAINTHYKIRIEVDKSNTEARVYINGVFAGRVTGTFPAADEVAARIVMLKSAGTAARTLLVYNFSAGAIY